MYCRFVDETNINIHINKYLEIDIDDSKGVPDIGKGQYFRGTMDTGLRYSLRDTMGVADWTKIRSYILYGLI